MAQEIIDIGLYANDPNADNLRLGGEKINSNFDELYEQVRKVALEVSLGVTDALLGGSTVFIVERMNARTTTLNIRNTPVFVSIANVSAAPGGSAMKYVYLFKGGPGVYGIGGLPVTSLMFTFISSAYLTPSDINNDPDAIIDSLGTLADGETFIDVANESVWNFTNSGTETDTGIIQRYFSFSEGGKLKFALFTGTAGSYGDNGNPFTDEMFVVTTDDTVVAEKTKLSEFKNDGSDGVNPYISYTDLNFKTYTIQGATTGNIRNDQPSFVTLDNGAILCAFNHFGASGSDIATAYIAGALSIDGGKTWGASFPLQTNISGALNTIVPSLYRRTDGKILMMYFVGIDPVPTPTSKIYKTVFNQNLTVFQAATDLGLTAGYYSPGSDRLYYDSANSALLFPTSKLVSGDGTSYGSVYKSTILKSTDQGATWTDLNINIGSTKLTLNFGGGIEPGIFYTSQGLVCYFRTLTGYAWGVKLDSSYAPTGNEYVLYTSANAQASIKYIPSKNIILATRTRLLDGNPIGDNSRKYLDLLTSEDGITFSSIDEIDFAPQTTNWLVNQPIVFDYNDKIIVGYNNSKTGALTASLMCKVYPKSFFSYKYNPYSYSGLLDDGRGKMYNGVQVINSTDNTKNTVSLKYPKGGSFYALSGTGAIKITMPGNRNANLTIKGRLVDESASNTFSFEITCNTSDMANYNKVRTDYPELARALNVRFVNGTNPKIFIGDLTSTWNNPSFIIDEVLASKAAYLNELAEGWKVELESASYGTVAALFNTADNSWLRSTTLLITNPPNGAAIKVDRGGGGFYVGVASGVDGYIFYNLNATAAFNRVFSNGNTIIGSDISTDNGYKHEVQGTGKYASTVKAAPAVDDADVVIKEQVQTIIRKTQTVDIPDLGSHASGDAASFTVAGAAEGDVVDVIPPLSILTDASLQALRISGFVSATDTVVVRGVNPTATSMAIPSASYKIIIRK